MLVCSYNVNSVRQRAHPAHDSLTPWLKEHLPDVVCLQELQCTANQFPHQAMAEAGYHALVAGEKGKNGVAIMTRLSAARPMLLTTPPWPPVEGILPDIHEARFIAAALHGVVVASVYVPYGRGPQDPQWQHKLHFYEQLTAWAKQVLHTGHRLLLAGDFNVAPAAVDAADLTQPGFRRTPQGPAQPSEVLWAPWCHADMRAALQELMALGLTDVGAEAHRKTPAFTMWDERNFHKGSPFGVRVDLLLACRALAQRVGDAGVHSAMREVHKASDHVPVFCQFSPSSNS